MASEAFEEGQDAACSTTVRRMGRLQSINRSQRAQQRALNLVLWALVALGALLATISMIATGYKGALGPAATLIAASVAALTALRLNETVDARRQRELRERRQEPYEQVVLATIGSFAGPNMAEAAKRVRVAVWGSPRLVELLTEWNELVAPLADQGVVLVPPQIKFKLMRLVGELVVEVRKETADDPASKRLSADVMAKLLFNDFSSDPGDGEAS